MTTKLDLRIGPVIHLPELLEKAGQNASAVFATAGVDQSLFKHPDNRIELADLGRLLQVASDAINRSDLGLLLADSFGPETLGVVLQIASEGPDLRTALRNIVRLLHYHDRSAFLSLFESDDRALLKYELRNPDVEGADIILAGSIGIAHRVIRSFCGGSYSPEEVRFSMRRPPSSSFFEAYFQVPVRFDSTEDALVFSRSWLETRVMPSLRVPEARRMLQTDTWDLADHVRHQIAMRIGLEASSASVVAKALGLSRRSLDRQLAAHRVTYSQLLNEVRFMRAQRLLAAGEVPLLDVSLALGYADHSAFSRAFHDWAGVSPTVWRRTHRTSDKGS